MDNDGKSANKEERKEMPIWLKYGFVAFGVIACAILLFFFVFRYQQLTAAVKVFIVIIQPIIYGLIIAYILNPIVVFCEKILMGVIGKKLKKGAAISRGFGILCAVAAGVGIISVLSNMVLPELYKSIVKLVITLPGQLQKFSDNITAIMNSDSNLTQIMEVVINRGTEYFQTWLQSDLLPKVNDIMSSLTVGVIGFVKTIVNIILGIIVSVYVLASKEVFKGQIKKLTYAILKPHYANIFLTTVRKSNDIFSGFIIGKIIDSFIIGILCFICMTILKMPYIVLVSVIIGVTNVIPFFGPYIGAVPTTILILLSNPIQGLYFVILILVLQQLDGNIIGPMILGDSTGLSPFWVVFAILVGGGLFGLLGMLIGVPTFAVIYYIVKQIVEHTLKKKKLPIDTVDYTDIKCINPITKELDYFDPDEEKEKIYSRARMVKDKIGSVGFKVSRLDIKKQKINKKSKDKDKN